MAQQVFGILAQKARLLVGRPSIAGWLYQAATHIATRLQVSELIPGGQHHAESVSQVMHLGSGLRSQMITDPKGKRGGVQLFFQGTLIESLRL